MLCDEDCLRKFPEAAFCRDVIREHIRCCGDVEKFFCLWKRPEHVPCEGLVKYMDCERPVEAWIAGEGLGRKEAYIMARKSLCGTAYSIDLNEVISSTGKEEAMPRLS